MKKKKTHLMVKLAPAVYVPMRELADRWDDSTFAPYTWPYTCQQFEQAFWHLWTLNTYHVTRSFDVNMVLLLDWAISYHMGQAE